MKDASPNETTELRTRFRLYVNGRLYSYCPELKGTSDTVDLMLPSGEPLPSGGYVTLEASELAKKNGDEYEVKSNKEVAHALLNFMPPNPFKLQNSSATTTPGCHGQGIKFDGAYFFSSCQQIADDWKAMAYIHDYKGTRLCSFEIDAGYDHPGGLVTLPGELGTAYVGFSVWSSSLPSTSNKRAQPLKISYANGQCSKAKLNSGNEIQNTSGFVARRPLDKCDVKSAWSTDLLFYDDYTANLNICKAAAVPGASPAPTPACWKQSIKPVSTESWYSSQDCGYYFAKGWLRACIGMSNDDNLIQVFSGDTFDMDETHRLGAPIYLSETWKSIGPWSGGFDIYQTPSGLRYLILAPDSPDTGDDCGREPCTDTQKNQWVEFYPFDSVVKKWPTGNCK